MESVKTPLTELEFQISGEEKILCSEYEGKKVLIDKLHPKSKYIMPDSFWAGELSDKGEHFLFIPLHEIKNVLMKHFGVGKYYFERFKEAGCSFYFDPTDLPQYYQFSVIHDEKYGQARYKVDTDMEKSNLTKNDWFHYIKDVLFERIVPVRAKELLPVLDELEKISKRLEELRLDELNRRKEILERFSKKRNYLINDERKVMLTECRFATLEEYLAYTFVNHGFENVDFKKDVSDLNFLLFSNGRCIITTEDDTERAGKFFTTA
jgi:hypothetical protein